MEPDLGTQEPAADQAAPAASAEPSAQPTAGESGRGEPSSTLAGGMDAFLRGALGAPTATSKPAEGAPSGEPAPQAGGDVEAGQSPPRGPDGKFLPRRGAAEAVRSAEERIADLEQQLAARDPEKLRQQWETERTTQAATDADAAEARADAERYERLRDVPDRDLSDEDYRWREERKALLASFPKAQRALAASNERVLAAERARLLGEHSGAMQVMADAIYATARKHGIEVARWETGNGATFESMTDDVIAPLQDRIAELERELHSARTVGPNGLGTLRVPTLAGRSDGGARSKTMDDWLRGN